MWLFKDHRKSEAGWQSWINKMRNFRKLTFLPFQQQNTKPLIKAPLITQIHGKARCRVGADG